MRNKVKPLPETNHYIKGHRIFIRPKEKLSELQYNRIFCMSFSLGQSSQISRFDLKVRRLSRRMFIIPLNEYVNDKELLGER